MLAKIKKTAERQAREIMKERLENKKETTKDEQDTKENALIADIKIEFSDSESEDEAENEKTDGADDGNASSEEDESSSSDDDSEESEDDKEDEEKGESEGEGEGKGEGEEADGDKDEKKKQKKNEDKTTKHKRNPWANAVLDEHLPDVLVLPRSNNRAFLRHPLVIDGSIILQDKVCGYFLHQLIFSER